jgi:ketosteroid isomerase-like protein
MSQENVEIVRACLEAFDRSDFDFIGATLAPDFAYSSGVTGTTYVGPNAARHLRSDIEDVISGYHVRLERLIDAQDHVIAAVRLIGSGRTSATPAEQFAAQVWTFRGGKLIHGCGFRTLAEALEAVGLAE